MLNDRFRAYLTGKTIQLDFSKVTGDVQCPDCKSYETVKWGRKLMRRSGGVNQRYCCKGCGHVFRVIK